MRRASARSAGSCAEHLVDHLRAGEEVGPLVPVRIHRRQPEPGADGVVVGDVGAPGVEEHAVAIEDDRAAAHRCAMTASANSSVPARAAEVARAHRALGEDRVVRRA